MKFLQRTLFLFLLLSSTIAFSNTYSDTNKIFNLLEELFPELLAPTQTQTIGDICLRHYPETEIYTAVICEDKGIYPFENLYVLISSQLHDLGNINQYRELFENQSDSDGSINTSTNSPGNGNCVNIPFPKDGLRATYASTSFGITRNEVITFNHVNNTSSEITWSATHIHEATNISKDIRKYNIIDDYIYTYSSNGTSSTSIPGFETQAVKYTTTFSPAINDGPAHIYCEQQSWDSGTVTAISTVETNGIVNTTTNTYMIEQSMVESVNETIITSSGSFNTVRVRKISQGTGTNSLIWFSIEHGVYVKNQTMDASGNIVNSSEITLIE